MVPLGSNGLTCIGKKTRENKKTLPSSVKVARQSFSSLLLRVEPGTSFLETVARGTSTSAKNSTQ